MEPRRRRTVRILAVIAGALWIAFLVSTASPGGEERVDVEISGAALLLEVLALVATVATVAAAVTAGTRQPDETPPGPPSDR